jgi:ribonuclease J
MDPKKTHLIPMGGCGEFGKNLTLYVRNRRIYVVDCGIKFADERMLGVSGLIPAVAEAFAEFGEVAAYLITHGHEDHIGGIPYIASRWPAPIFCTPWTRRLIEKRLNRLGWPPDTYELNTVQPGAELEFSDLKVTYVPVNHSIPHCCSLYMRFPDCKIFHTGDFKIDPDPVVEPKTDFRRLAAIGASGVDYMISDSTSVEIPGPSLGEKDVKKALLAVVAEAKGRIYLTTFASNFWRVKSIMEICSQLGKKLFVAGTGFFQTLELAREFEMIGTEAQCIVEEHELAGLPRDQTVVLASGSQGEWRSAMYRISLDELPNLRVRAGDTAIFSARVIPGNEKNLFQLMSRLRYFGASLIYPRSHPGIHISGHAQRGDVEVYLEHLKPKHFFAVHGTYLQLTENQQIGMNQTTGQTSLLLENGSMIALGEQPLPIGKLEVKAEFIDQGSSIPMDYETIRDRHRLGENGGAILSGVMGKNGSLWLSPLEVTLIGISLASDRATEDFLADLETFLMKSVRHFMSQMAAGKSAQASDPEKIMIINEHARRVARKYFFDEIKTKPVVMSHLFLT